ncbi:hypothetical protein K7X08_026076 [Anisodus acutangulus]|uniref:Uncharacterized protein n=1 Tax=Anisodus acutangulus TaxID=402998 RepID=A0A9Q1N3G6_9SOLA|nr:hypothetical protein K7X08_026076 [Anisodus acutangulus]
MVKGKTVLDDDKLKYSFYIGNVRESAMVTTKGNMYQYDTILVLVTSMDVSSNNLSGDIPISLTRLAGLKSFNFSKNNLTGRIPNDIGDMKVLESVDLSENQHSGRIPQSLSSLSTLAYLNLSDNNLSAEHEKRKHKLKRLVQSPDSFFMDIIVGRLKSIQRKAAFHSLVKCQGCFNITTVFSHSKTGGLRELTDGVVPADWWVFQTHRLCFELRF